MAKPSSAHNDEPVAARVRATRQTRSQSAEPSKSAGPASRGRGGALKNDDDEAAVMKKRGRSKKSAGTAPDLTTVEEDPGFDSEAQLHSQLQPQGDPSDEPQDEPDNGNDEDRRTSRAISTFSGTTAHTSFSEDEIAQMDHEIMIDMLPGFAAASDALARHLIPHGIKTDPATWKEILHQGSTHNKQYRNRLATISIHKEHFGSQEYLHSGIVLRALLGVTSAETLPPAPWRPDNIVLKINLVQMGHSLLILCHPNNGDSERVNALARLALVFPEAIAGGEYQPAALEIWLNIAAHLCIAQLEAHGVEHHFNPEAVIDNIFYDENGAFLHMDALGLPQPDRKTALSMVNNLVKELKRAFGDFDGTDVTPAIGRLKSQFRWDALQDHFLRFYETWGKQLDGRIAQTGGVAQIVKGLAEEVDRRATFKTSERLYENAIARSTPRKSLGGGSGMAALKRREKAAAVQAADDVDEEETSPDSGAEHPDLPQTAQAFRRGEDRRRRFIDPQPDAVRISTKFDEETQEPSQPQRRPETAKRPFAQIEEGDDDYVFDPTQDEGFQVDARDFAAADQRRREAALSKAKASTRVRDTSSTADAGPSNYAPQSARPSPSKRQRVNPGSALPPPIRAPDVDDDALPPSSRYARAKVEAKLNRVTASQNKEPRARVAWSDAEETALMELIEEHGGEGVSYSFLKSIDEQDEEPRLRRRNAEDLRFKARIMKVTMLLAGGVLPANWEHVVLDKKAIDKLHNRGIRYYQERLRKIEY